MKKLLMIPCIVLTLFSCASSKTVIEEPSVKNPTFYVFPKSKQEVEKAIMAALDKSSKRSTFGEYFLNEYPKGNFKLMPVDGNLSKVYFRKTGEAYLYRPAKIQILTDSIAESSTKVSINVVDPKVRTRLTLLPTIPWMQRGWKYKPVPATTVEEYEILLMTGKELQEENMPALKIPDKIVF